jgi:hypothetical protein
LADLINLRLARKNKARNHREQSAAENRDKFGRSKLARNQARANSLRDKAHLDGHKLTDLPIHEHVESKE